jgi:hypothetical protein
MQFGSLLLGKTEGNKVSYDHVYFQFTSKTGGKLTVNPHAHCFCDLGAGGIEGIVYVKENDELVICDWMLKGRRRPL